MTAPYTHRGSLLWHQRLCRGRWAGQQPQWVHCWLRWWWSRQCHWSKWWRCQNALVQLCRPPSRPLPQTWTQWTEGWTQFNKLISLRDSHADCPTVQIRIGVASLATRFLIMWPDCTVCTHSRRQHLREQFFRFLFLDLQLFRSLSNQLLQVRRVLLQHPQHGVYDVCLLSLIDVFKLSGHCKRQGRTHRDKNIRKKYKNVVLILRPDAWYSLYGVTCSSCLQNHICKLKTGRRCEYKCLFVFLCGPTINWWLV